MNWIGFTHSRIFSSNKATWRLINAPDDFELVGVGVVELGLRVGVLGLKPGDVRVLLGGEEGGRRVDRGKVQRRPGQRLLLGGDLLQVAPVPLRGFAGGRGGRCCGAGVLEVLKGKVNNLFIM